MINPSIYGWIDKFFFEQNTSNQTIIKDAKKFYTDTRKTGFLLGYTTHFAHLEHIETKGLKKEELSKIGLLNSLFGVFQLCEKSLNSTDFKEKCVRFYNELQTKNSSLWNKIMPEERNSSKLEKIINSRIQTNENSLSKNFSHILTNALLFIDVLAFNQFLLNGKIPEKYLKKTEDLIINLVSLALKSKKVKTKYDQLLQKLFESSVRYSKFNEIEIESIDHFNFTVYNDLEKFYILDMAGMAMWSDYKMEISEEKFLIDLSTKLNISIAFLKNSIQETDSFLKKNKSDIPYFNFSNPVKHFYDHTTQNVQTLISRNKTRLLLEISQSKELMRLLAQSTKRDLSPEEKKKVRNQLLDICKTIPSLTIFIIPGGSLLLPILIKFIPQLLPSAFNENLNND